MGVERRAIADDVVRVFETITKAQLVPVIVQLAERGEPQVQVINKFSFKKIFPWGEKFEQIHIKKFFSVIFTPRNFFLTNSIKKNVSTGYKKYKQIHIKKNNL